jgi:hypothetical protein
MVDKLLSVLCWYLLVQFVLFWCVSCHQDTLYSDLLYCVDMHPADRMHVKR